MRRQVARRSTTVEKTGVAACARGEVEQWARATVEAAKQKARDTISTKQPGRLERLKDMIYTNVLGKGHELSFAVDTPIQLQLALGPTPDRDAG